MKLSAHERRTITAKQADAPRHKPPRPWTADEIDFIRNNYPSGAWPASRIAHRLDRSVTSVIAKTRKLGVASGTRIPLDERERRLQALLRAIECQGSRRVVREELGVSDALISHWVKGRKVVHWQYLEQIERLGGGE